MFILSDDAFSWLEFHPERLQDPAVIIGIVLMVLGLILSLFAKVIASIPALRKWEERKANTNGSLVESISRITGAVITFVGVFIVLILGK